MDDHRRRGQSSACYDPLWPPSAVERVEHNTFNAKVISMTAENVISPDLEEFHVCWCADLT
jgi:hypothetical protein